MTAATTATPAALITRKPTPRMIETLQKIAAELATSNEHYIHWPATPTLLALEARGLIVTYPNRTGGPDPRVVMHARGRRFLHDLPVTRTPAPTPATSQEAAQAPVVAATPTPAAPAPARPVKPINAMQRTDLHMVWTLCVANGGMTRLRKYPGALITRGYVVQTASKPRRYYAVTAAGRQIAEQIEAANQDSRRGKAFKAATPAPTHPGPLTLYLGDIAVRALHDVLAMHCENIEADGEPEDTETPAFKALADMRDQIAAHITGLHGAEASESYRPAGMTDSEYAKAVRPAVQPPLAYDQSLNLTDDDRAAMATETAPGMFAGPVESAPCDTHTTEKYYYRIVWTDADVGPEQGFASIVRHCPQCMNGGHDMPGIVARGVRYHTPTDRILAVLPRHMGRPGMRVTLAAPRHGMSPRVVTLGRIVDTRTDEEAWSWTTVS